MNLRKLALCAVAGVMAASMIFAAGCGGDKTSDKKVLKAWNVLTLLITGLRTVLTAVP